MAQVTLSNSNSKVVVAIANNSGFRNRVKALVFEHALNLRDGTPSANEGAISHALIVNADPAAATLADSATDAQVRANFDAVISRCIDAWVAGQS